MNRTYGSPAARNGEHHPLRHSTASLQVVPPLGVLMVGRRTEAWHRAAEGERPAIADPLKLDIPRRDSESRAYRVYGFGETGEGNPWEFFYLLEVDDFEAWKHLQCRFEADGFRRFFECEVLALGRRLK